MDVERQAAIGLKWSSVAKLASQTLSWIVTLIVLRLLVPGDYGLMAVSAVIISIIAGMAEFGLGAALIQAERLEKEELSRIAGALGLLNLACGFGVFLAAPAVSEVVGDLRLEPVLRISSLQFLLYAVEVVPQSLMQREMHFRKNAVIELASALTTSIATLALAMANAGVWALVLGNLAGGATRTILLIASTPFTPPSLRFTGISRHLRFGGIVTLTRFLWHLTYQLDTLIAARFLGREAVGLYSVALQLAQLPVNKAMGVVNQIALPAVARLQDDLVRLRARLLDALRLLAFAAIPILWGISAVAPEFTDVVLGERWHKAIVALQLISLVAPLRMLMAVLGTAVSAIGRAEVELQNTVVSVIILPLAFLIGVRAQISGLAVSWLVAVPIIFALNFPRTGGALGLRMWDLILAFRAPVVGGCAMYAAVVLTRGLLLNHEEALRLPFLIAAGAATYVAVVRILDAEIWQDARRLLSAVRE